MCEFGDLGVLHRQDSRQRFDDRDLGAQVTIETCEFDPDRAGPHDEQSLGHDARQHRFLVGPDELTVDFESGKRARSRTRGENDVLRFELEERLTLTLDRDSPRPGQSPETIVDVDTILLHQVFDTGRQALRDLAGSLHDLLEIESDLSDREAKLACVLGKMQDLRAAKECLGRHATPIQTDASEMFSFDERHGETQLTGANRSRIASWATANDDHVVGCIAHRIFPIVLIQVPSCPTPSVDFGQSKHHAEWIFQPFTQRSQ